MGEVQYEIGAIETFYKGFRFRSRLEARWAAFFDLCGWQWEYEPADFDGWFPDFLLTGERRNEIFVEVKPIAESCPDLQRRIDRSGCSHECLIVGRSPLTVLRPYCGDGGIFRLGWLREEVQDGNFLGGGHVAIDESLYPTGWCWDDAELYRLRPRAYTDSPQMRQLLSRYELDFCHATGDYTSRISGVYDGPAHIGDIGPCRLHELWGLAHEMTRYDPS